MLTIVGLWLFSQRPTASTNYQRVIQHNHCCQAALECDGEIFNLTDHVFCIGNLIWALGNFQMAVSRKWKKLLEIRWSQNSRIVQGFHPLFHESDLAPLFHPLSASFLKEPLFRGVPDFRKFQKMGQNMPLGPLSM